MIEAMAFYYFFYEKQGNNGKSKVTIYIHSLNVHFGIIWHHKICATLFNFRHSAVHIKAAPIQKGSVNRYRYVQRIKESFEIRGVKWKLKNLY